MAKPREAPTGVGVSRTWLFRRARCLRALEHGVLRDEHVLERGLIGCPEGAGSTSAGDLCGRPEAPRRHSVSSTRGQRSAMFAIPHILRSALESRSRLATRLVSELPAYQVAFWPDGWELEAGAAFL